MPKHVWTHSEEAAALTVVLRRATAGLAAVLATMGVPTRKAAIFMCEDRRMVKREREARVDVTVRS